MMPATHTIPTKHVYTSRIDSMCTVTNQRANGLASHSVGEGDKQDEFRGHSRWGSRKAYVEAWRWRYRWLVCGEKGLARC